MGASVPPQGRHAFDTRSILRAVLRAIIERMRSAPRSIAITAFLAWCVLIFVLSAQPVVELGFSFRPLPAWIHNLLHAPGFGTFAVLFLWAVRRRGEALATGHRRVALAVVAVLVYGASDEWHQSFTPGRDPSVCDVLTDVVGGWFAAALLCAIEEAAPRARIARLLLVGVLACVLAALIATFVPAKWPELGWL
jgi:hypothetical protein